jgi:hypothetical protein
VEFDEGRIMPSWVGDWKNILPRKTIAMLTGFVLHFVHPGSFTLVVDGQVFVN